MLQSANVIAKQILNSTESAYRFQQIWMKAFLGTRFVKLVNLRKLQTGRKFFSISNIQKRTYASVNQVFNRRAKVAHKEYPNAFGKEAEVYEYLRDEVAFQISDRIADVSRDFPLAFDIGCGRGFISSHLTKEDSIGKIIQGDLSYNTLANAKQCELPTSSITINEENLAFRESVFDLVMSSLSLHWVNDLPGCFKQVLQILKPDGCFLGAVFGGDTLFELRCALQLAETEREGGMAPHISPFLQGNDLANLLINSGFNLVTADMDQIVINYPSMFEVMDDVKGMGENNALHTIKPLRRDTIAAASSIYQALYANDDGSVPATYQILYFIGWRPDKSQQKPLERGSTPKGFQVKKGENETTS